MCIRFSSDGKNFKVCHPKPLASLCRYGIGCSSMCICWKRPISQQASQQTQSTKKKRKKKKKIKKKTRSLRYIDTDFRWADSHGIRYNRFYVIANYVISVVTCIHFKWSSAGPRRGLRNNRELRYIDCWLYHGAKKSKMTKNSNQGGGPALITYENFQDYSSTQSGNQLYCSESWVISEIQKLLCSMT